MRKFLAAKKVPETSVKLKHIWIALDRTKDQIKEIEDVQKEFASRRLEGETDLMFAF